MKNERKRKKKRNTDAGVNFMGILFLHLTFAVNRSKNITKVSQKPHQILLLFNDIFDLSV